MCFAQGPQRSDADEVPHFKILSNVVAEKSLTEKIKIVNGEKEKINK